MKGPERLGPFRAEYERNKRRVLQLQSVCGICGKPVDKSLKYPHPMSATIDHIIPIARGGHPSDMDNLQLAHMCCNRAKSDDMPGERISDGGNVKELNRNLPWTIDWKNYKSTA